MADSIEPTSTSITLRATVFLCGAVVMVLELTGSRLLAPYFGNGLFVWTALIGIMLGFMSLGNYLGGRLADRSLHRQTLFWILAGSGVSIGIISFTEPLLLPLLSSAGSVRFAAVAATIALFAMPCTGLGMVTPYSVRYAIRSLVHSGATVGTLFALGTLGSIAGTFLGGFYLIAHVGSHNLIAWLALVPIALAGLFFERWKWQQVAMLVGGVALVVSAMATTASALDTFDTGYDRYVLLSTVDGATGRNVKGIARDSSSFESAVYSDTGEPYLFDYYGYYDIASAVAGATEPVKRTLMLGGGTFVYPRHQLAKLPDSQSDVIEIDPQLVDVARTQFFLEDDPRLRIHIEDARTYLNRVSEPGTRNSMLGAYDVALIDVFKSAKSVPYQLTTRETMQMVSDVLDEDGVVVMNIIANPRGRGARFLSAEFKTVASVFPQAAVFAVRGLEVGDELQNVSIIATKRPVSDAKLAQLLDAVAPETAAHRIDPATLPQDVPVLTDDFAPVDQYLMDLSSPSMEQRRW